MEIFYQICYQINLSILQTEKIKGCGPFLLEVRKDYRNFNSQRFTDPWQNFFSNKTRYTFFDYF